MEQNKTNNKLINLGVGNSLTIDYNYLCLITKLICKECFIKIKIGRRGNRRGRDPLGSRNKKLSTPRVFTTKQKTWQRCTRSF